MTIEIDVSTITCPNCNQTFAIYFVDMGSGTSGTLVKQVPDSGAPFYCVYCGVDVNKQKGGVKS